MSKKLLILDFDVPKLAEAQEDYKFGLLTASHCYNYSQDGWAIAGVNSQGETESLREANFRQRQLFALYPELQKIYLFSSSTPYRCLVYSYAVFPWSDFFPFWLPLPSRYPRSGDFRDPKLGLLKVAIAEFLSQQIEISDFVEYWDVELDKPDWRDSAFLQNYHFLCVGDRNTEARATTAGIPFLPLQTWREEFRVGGFLGK